jgi:hypothetical protein
VTFEVEYWFDIVEVPFRLYAYRSPESGELEIEPLWITEPFASFDGDRRLAIALEPGADGIVFRSEFGPAGTDAESSSDAQSP